MAKDDLGNRMKAQYENRFRHTLPRRTYTVIRCDGKSFHSYTRGLERPFDKSLMDTMDYAALALCKELQGARMAYVQSDEISVLLTDFDDIGTESWFDGNIQKSSSVAASIATAAFNYKALETLPLKINNGILARFDARCFTIPDPVEVSNYFIWRSKDWQRNSVQMLARSLYSHKELQGKNIAALHEMLYDKDVNWNNLSSTYKNGRMVTKGIAGWQVEDQTPIFTQDREYLKNLIPLLSYE